MQLLVKNLHNQEFKVECDGDDSIKELKEKIAKQTVIEEKYNPELIKLLCKGKVMDDEDSINNYSLDDNSYVVLVKQLPGKPKPPPKKKPTAAFNNHMGMGGFGGFGGFGSSGMMQNSFQSNLLSPSPFSQNTFPQPMYNPGAATASSATTQQFQQPAYVPPASTGAFVGGFEDTNPGASSMSEDHEDALRSLISMGFAEDVSQEALRASFYNVETAIDLITSGNIPKPKPPIASQTSASSRPSQTQNQRSNPTSTGDGGTMAQLQQISQMLRNNPEQLQLIKQSLKDTHPEIAQMIDNDPQTFLDMLKQASGEASNAQVTPPPPSSRSNSNNNANANTSTPTAVTLTVREEEIINRFQEMGFDRDRAIEAFLLADRDEQVAANYLLS